jgi:hypothetical protein
VDGSGNSHVTGSFGGTATFGSTTLTDTKDGDIFVAKYDPDGNVLWAVQAGGIEGNTGNGIAVDGLGNSYVTGSFQGDAAFDGTTLTSAGSSDIFVAKYDPDGNVVWVTQTGNAGQELGRGIALDGSRNSYVTGVSALRIFLAKYGGGNLPPVANAGSGVKVECTSFSGALVSLDGTGSSDPNNDSLTFFWTASGIVFDDPTSPTPSATFPLGTTTVTLTVTDPDGFSDSDTAKITVQDTTPPTVSVAASPTSLWPPNHKYVPISLSVSASDGCDPLLHISVVAQSNEPDDAPKADGSTTGDIRVTTAGGTVRQSSNSLPKVFFDPSNDRLELRAERNANGVGRTYSITVTAAETVGSLSDQATANVTVPLNRRASP